MTIRGGGSRFAPWLLYRGKEWVRRFGASLPMRMAASWFGSPGPPEKGCGAIDPRPKASSPLFSIPTAPSVRSCSELSRYGLARAEHAARLVRRPTLTAPARDEHGRSAGRDEGTAFGSNKGTDEGRAPACRNSLTSKAPYKGQPPVLTSSNPISTLLQRFACAR